MEDPGHWSVDKRIPISSIISGFIFILGQTWFLAWWISGVSYRVTTVEDFMRQSQPQAAQIAVLQEKINTVQSSLNKIEIWLSKGVAPAKP